MDSRLEVLLKALELTSHMVDSTLEKMGALADIATSENKPSDEVLMAVLSSVDKTNDLVGTTINRVLDKLSPETEQEQFTSENEEHPEEELDGWSDLGTEESESEHFPASFTRLSEDEKELVSKYLTEMFRNWTNWPREMRRIQSDIDREMISIRTAVYDMYYRQMDFRPYIEHQG